MGGATEGGFGGLVIKILTFFKIPLYIEQVVKVTASTCPNWPAPPNKAPKLRGLSKTL
jgi:hypothetical protein